MPRIQIQIDEKPIVDVTAKGWLPPKNHDWPWWLLVIIATLRLAIREIKNA